MQKMMNFLMMHNVQEERIRSNVYCIILRDEYDLVKFIKMVQQASLFVNLQIGPYVCAEWNFGGFPVWLKYVSGIVFRRTMSLSRLRIVVEEFIVVSLEENVRGTLSLFILCAGILLLGSSHPSVMILLEFGHLEHEAKVNAIADTGVMEHDGEQEDDSTIT
ncbi:hypothetical protein EV1_043169 [Malus domestica]